MRHGQTQTSVLAHYNLDYKIALSTAPLAPCVLSGSGSSLVVSPGYPMPPIFNPPVPSQPFPSLIDCLPVLFYLHFFSQQLFLGKS